MTTISPSIQRLAEQLLALESAAPTRQGHPSDPVIRICETLRAPLINFVGTPGYRSLLARALVLARPLDPSLASVRITDDGAIEGLGAQTPPADHHPPETGRVTLGPAQVRPTDPAGPRPPGPPPGAQLVIQLLGLLAVFIGEPLTLRLVQDAWPHAPALDPSTESQS